MNRTNFIIPNEIVDFFSNKLGVEFKELIRSEEEKLGLRFFFSHKHQIEIISPIPGFSDNLPPTVKKRVHLLDENEMIVMSLVFDVKDPEKAARDAEREGIRVAFTFEGRNYASLGMDNLFEWVAVEEDTFGSVFAFGKYDKV